MKITKRQLRRIIREEKAEVLAEQGRFFADVEAGIEESVLEMVDMIVNLNGVSENEAKQMTIDHVKDLLGIR